MSIALKPLILEIQSLKSEILSLKKERDTTKITQNLSESIHAQKARNIQQTDIQSVNSSSKSTQKITKKTFAEIAKLNETLSEQSIKLDKWTVVKGTKKTQIAKK